MFSERLKIKINRGLRRILAAPRLHRLDTHPMPRRKPGEVWLFLICRNEALRLPYMLKYHFDAGISRVILLDNGSTDATLDLIRDDSRIHVFQTRQNFAGNKVVWQEILLRRYGAGHWNLLLDADELFVYPGMDTLPLSAFVQRLEAEGAAAIHSIFIEMFPKEPLGQIAYRPESPLTDAAPWFDAAGYVRKKYHAVFSGAAPTHILMGGTRERIFGGEFGCSKYPLFKYRPGQFFRLGLHTVEGAKLSAGQAAILHFKYLQDFHAKVLRESQRNVYWNAAAEYKAYAARFAKEGDFSLWHPGAQKFTSWRTLRDLDLIRPPAAPSLAP